MLKIQGWLRCLQLLKLFLEESRRFIFHGILAEQVQALHQAPPLRGPRRLLSIKHPRFRSCSWASGSSSRSWRWVCSPSPGNFPSLGGQSTPPCLLGEGKSLPNFSSSYGNARVPGDATCNRCKCISWTKTLFSLWSVFTSLDFEKFEQNCMRNLLICHSQKNFHYFLDTYKNMYNILHTHIHEYILFDILDSPRPQQPFCIEKNPPFGPGSWCGRSRVGVKPS